MFHASLAAGVFVVAIATNPMPETAGPPAHLSVQQKQAAMQPLVRSATECIARAVSADSHFKPVMTDLGDLIVASVPSCVGTVRAMIDGYDRYYGDGSGEAFFQGPYLDILPVAVNEWIRNSSR
jgi:hypothetical protein